MTGFFARLKQRKLLQWALAYVAFASALIQGLDVVAHQFGWPDGLQRGITLALVIGFFVAIVLAWYHGEHGAQRANAPSVDDPGRVPPISRRKSCFDLSA